jgi:hypothetical protein
VDPIRRLVEVARDERAKRTVKTGQQVFSTIRNVAAIGAAAASIVTGGFFVTRDRPPEQPAAAATAATTAPLTLLEQLRGSLAFEASFLQDLGTPQPLPSGAAPTAPLSARADGVDFAGPGAYTPLIIRHAVPAKYLLELELVAKPGTDAIFNYTPRTVGPQQYQVAVDVANELIRFQHIDRSVTPQRVTSLITNAIPAAGLGRGQVLKLAAAVDGTRYRLFVGGQLVAEVTDARVNVADSPTTSLAMGASVNKGMLSMNALRVYALADALSTQPLLTQLKGQPVYEPTFPKDLATAPPLPSGARPTAQVRSRADVVDILPSGGYAPIITNRQVPARYVAELELQCQATTDGQFGWTLRSAGSRTIQFVLDPANELLRFVFNDSGVTPNQNVSLIPSTVSVAGVQKGRVLHLAVAVDAGHYRLFLDGELIGDVTDSRIPVSAAAQTTIIIGGSLTRGGFTVGKLRVYDLREVAASPSPRP